MARVNDVADNLNFPLSHIFHFRLSASRQGRGTETNNPVVTRRCRSPISPNSQFSSGRENVKFPERAIAPPSVSSHATNEEGHRIVGISRSVRSWPRARARPREGSHDFSLSPPQSGFGGIQGRAKLMELSLVTHVPSGPIGCAWAGHFAWQK